MFTVSQAKKLAWSQNNLNNLVIAGKLIKVEAFPKPRK
jgi:hypothetical protein